MYNKTMGCLECLAHGFKTMCKANIFLLIIQFCVFFLTHIFLSPHIRLFYFGLLENLVFIYKNKVMKVIIFFILCYKISPIIFTITIIFCRHVTNVTSQYKISPIMFTITIIFCRHVTNVSNITSCYKISPIIFTITIIFFRHVTNVTNVTSRYKISPILGCRAPLGTMKKKK